MLHAWKNYGGNDKPTKPETWISDTCYASYGINTQYLFAVICSYEFIESILWVESEHSSFVLFQLIGLSVIISLLSNHPLIVFLSSQHFSSFLLSLQIPDILNHWFLPYLDRRAHFFFVYSRDWLPVICSCSHV